MHTIEPHYNWRVHYVASDDKRSPFYQREYSEFEFTNSIYDHLIHPQWDNFGSPTLYMKILYVSYETGVAIFELIGEWNDCIHNDIMYLKRHVADVLIREGINKFILIGENVLNFHSMDDCYYEEWFQDIEQGWVALLNFREHVLNEMGTLNLNHFVNWGGALNDLSWRTFEPLHLYKKVYHILTQETHLPQDTKKSLP